MSSFCISAYFHTCGTHIIFQSHGGINIILVSLWKGIFFRNILSLSPLLLLMPDVSTVLQKHHHLGNVMYFSRIYYCKMLDEILVHMLRFQLHILTNHVSHKETFVI